MTETIRDVRIDKLWLNHYLKNYEEFLGPLRFEPIRLLELGIAKGDSLKHWRDWLPEATIAGLDINRVKIDDPSGRIHCYQGEQQDPAVLDRIGEEIAPDGFDVIIDDASHVGQLSRISFWHLYENHLKPGGFYFIEDWGTGYWPAYPDGKRYTPPAVGYNGFDRLMNSLNASTVVKGIKPLRKAVGYARWHWVQAKFPSHQRGMVGFVKELVDECGIADATHPEFGHGEPRVSRFEWVRYSHGHVIVKKPMVYPPANPSRAETGKVEKYTFELSDRMTGTIRAKGH